MQPYRVQDRTIDDYNPFAPTASMTVNEQPASGDPSAVAIQQRMAELDARAAELSRQEEEHMKRMQYSHESLKERKNFPPLPTCCPCEPCFYQDIDLEISPAHNQLIMWMFRLWLFYGFILVLNVIACLVYMVSKNPTSETGTTFALSIIFLVLFFPGSYICWFRPLYNAFKKDSSANFVIFFVIFWCQIAVNIIQALGINWFASCGFINGFGALSRGATGAGTLMIILGGFFTGLSVVEIFFVIQIHRIYRTQGGNIVRARQEVVETVISGNTNSGIRNFGSTSSTR